MIRPIESTLRPYMARKTETPRLTLATIRQGKTITPRAPSFGIREPAFDRSHRKGN